MVHADILSETTPILSVSQQFVILSAVEDLQTVTPRVYAQCEECFRSTLLEHQSSSRGTSDGLAPPSPRALLKKSVSALSASTFSLIGNDMLESARAQSSSASGPASVGNSGVLVPQSENKHATRARGWDWRMGLSATTKGEDVLRLLRTGLARGLSYRALGSS